MVADDQQEGAMVEDGQHQLQEPPEEEAELHLSLRPFLVLSLLPDLQIAHPQGHHLQQHLYHHHGLLGHSLGRHVLLLVLDLVSLSGVVGCSLVNMNGRRVSSGNGGFRGVCILVPAGSTFQSQQARVLGIGEGGACIFGPHMLNVSIPYDGKTSCHCRTCPYMFVC